jgi:hypothetical protein
MVSSKAQATKQVARHNGEQQGNQQGASSKVKQEGKTTRHKWQEQGVMTSRSNSKVQW